MGLEALSRGAASAVFVENDREACRTIDRNLDKLAPHRRARPLRRTPLRALAAEAPPVTATISCWSIRPTRCFLPCKTGFPRYLPAVLADDGLVVVETGAESTSRSYRL